MIGKSLKYGDTIGIVSPASPENFERIQEGLSHIKRLGFNIKEGKHMYDKWGYLAGSDKDRAQDIMDMFCDDEVDMILCTRGGYGSMRLLPYLDFEIIKSNPKIFMGYSDITTLLNFFASQCGLITFHGPMVTSDILNEVTATSFLSTLMYSSQGFIINNPEGTPLITNSCASVEGQLVGGNLSLICSTMGTPYEIDTCDKILFIEDVGEEPYSIDRMLTQLLLGKKLQNCKGFILGQFTDCTLPHYERSLTLEDVLLDRLYSLNKPVVSNLMAGHDNPKLTLPIGAQVKLHCANTLIELLEPIVK